MNRFFGGIRNLVVTGLALSIAACSTGGRDATLRETLGLDAAPELLRQQFPEQAAMVLEQKDEFVASERGFALGPPVPVGTWRDLEVTLPLEGTGVARMRVPGGFEVRVRELGAEGTGKVTASNVLYRRAGGTSFWTAAPGVYEEWLHLFAARRGEAVAIWEIEGATVELQGDEVELVDESGVPRIRVSAPVAYAAGTGEVAVKLKVEGTRIELYVEADGEVLVDPLWLSAGSLSHKRYGHTETRLPNGEVLVTGGHDQQNYLGSAERYNPSTNTWSSAGSMSVKHHHHTATLLPNGKVLVAGGHNLTQGNLKAVELYNPSTNSWTTVKPMTYAQEYHTATLLPNGNVLVAGASKCQIYNPSANIWTTTGAMLTGRENHTATLLLNGKVLIAGGLSAVHLNSAELYDPALGTWVQTGSMSTARFRHTQVLLLDGRVLITGGQNSNGALASAELYDPITKVWTPAASMTSVRRNHTATRLEDGTVLVAGGAIIGEAPVSQQVLDSAELWNPYSGAWTPTSSMTKARRYVHSATLLTGGTVLMVGGAENSEVALPNSERYKPDGGPCQNNADCDSGFCIGGVCCNTACVVPNGTPACPSGTCLVASCNAGHADCDGNATNGCEVDLSNAGSCPVSGCNPNAPNGTPCNDGNPCTQGDTCQAGICTGGSPKTCLPWTLCHVAGVCNPADGVCSNPDVPNGTACDDGNECTQTNTCQAGICTGSNSKACLPEECRVAGTCDPLSGVCSNPSKPNGTACNDNNLCTLGETCQSGDCGSGASKCPVLDQCHVGGCDPSNGTCSSVNAPEGKECDDGKVNTFGDKCQSGVCSGVAGVNVSWVNGVSTGNSQCTIAGATCIQAHDGSGSVISCAAQSLGGTAQCSGLVGKGIFWANGTSSGNSQCAIVGSTCTLAYDGAGLAGNCVLPSFGGTALCSSVVGKGVFWANGTSSGSSQCAIVGSTCTQAYDGTGFAGNCVLPSFGGTALCSGVVGKGVFWANGTSSGNSQCAIVGSTCTQAYDGTGFVGNCAFPSFGGTALCSNVVGKGVFWANGISSGNSQCAIVGSTCTKAYDGTGFASTCAFSSFGGTALCSNVVGKGVFWANSTSSGNVQCAIVGSTCTKAYNGFGVAGNCAIPSFGGTALCQ